jgi:hypothetical protein
MADFKLYVKDKYTIKFLPFYMIVPKSFCNFDLVFYTKSTIINIRFMKRACLYKVSKVMILPACGVTYGFIQKL